MSVTSTTVATAITTQLTPSIVTPTTKISPNRNAVLVLSSFESSNKPFIVDLNGKYFVFFLLN